MYGWGFQAIPQAQFHAVLASAAVLVNSSLSEGMYASIVTSVLIYAPYVVHVFIY